MTYNTKIVIGSASVLASIVSLAALANSSAFAQLLPSVSRSLQQHHAEPYMLDDHTNKIDRMINETTRSVLGEYNITRLREFADLSQGWDSGRGQRMNLLSLELVSRFLSDTKFRPDNPSVFMSADGNIVINWLDRGDESSMVELEFRDSGINYYIEMADEEGTVVASNDAFRRLIGMIAPNEANAISYTPQSSDDSVATQIISMATA